MSTNTISKINFNAPIIFPQKFLQEKSPLKKFFIQLGSAADSYVYFGKHYVNATTLQQLPIKGHAWKTAIKIISYVLTAFILPALAWIASSFYKDWATKNLLHPETTNKSKEPLVQNALPQSVPSKTALPEQEDTKLIQPEPSKDEKKETLNAKKTAELKIEINKADLDAAIKDLELIADKEEKEINKKIIEHLEALNTETDDKKKLVHLLELHKLSESDNKYDTIRGKMMKNILHPELPKLSEVVDQKQEGQMFRKFPGVRVNPSLPDKFIDLSTFVDIMIERIIKSNPVGLRELSAGLEPDQKLLLQAKFERHREEGGNIVKKDIHVSALSGSGKKRLFLFQIVGQAENPGEAPWIGKMRFVTKEDFEKGTPNPWADDNMWNQARPTEGEEVDVGGSICGTNPGVETE